MHGFKGFEDDGDATGAETPTTVARSLPVAPMPQLFVSHIDLDATSGDLRRNLESVVPVADILGIALQLNSVGTHSQVAYVTLDLAVDIPHVLRALAQRGTRPTFSQNLAKEPYFANDPRLASLQTGSLNRPLKRAWSLSPPAREGEGGGEGGRAAASLAVAQLFVSGIQADSSEASLRRALALAVPALDLVHVALRPGATGQVAHLTLAPAVDVRRLVRQLKEQLVELDSARLSFDILRANPPPSTRPRSRSSSRR